MSIGLLSNLLVGIAGISNGNNLGGYGNGISQYNQQSNIFGNQGLYGGQSLYGNQGLYGNGNGYNCGCYPPITQQCGQNPLSGLLEMLLVLLLIKKLKNPTNPPPIQPLTATTTNTGTATPTTTTNNTTTGIQTNNSILGQLFQLL